MKFGQFKRFIIKNKIIFYEIEASDIGKNLKLKVEYFIL